MEIRKGVRSPRPGAPVICPIRVSGSPVLVSELQMLLTPEPSVQRSVLSMQSCEGTCEYGQMHIVCMWSPKDNLDVTIRTLYTFEAGSLAGQELTD